MGDDQKFGYLATTDSFILVWERPKVILHILFELDRGLIILNGGPAVKERSGSLRVRLIEPASSIGREYDHQPLSKELGDLIAKVIDSLSRPDEIRQVWPTGPMIEKLIEPVDSSTLSADHTLIVSYEGQIDPQHKLLETVTLTLRDGNTLAFKLEDRGVMEGNFLLRPDAYRAMVELFDFVKVNS